MTCDLIAPCLALIAALPSAPLPPNAAAPRPADDATVLCPENAVPWDYVVGTEMEPHCLQDYRLYLPDATRHERPADGWPVLIHLDLANFATTEDFPFIDPDLETPLLLAETHRFLARVLDAGIAVVTARVTPSTCLDAWPCVADVPGHGLFHPPGLELLDPAGDPVTPYDALDYAMAEKDAVLVVQHVRYEADRPGGPLEGLDASRIAIEGSSAGAVAAMWTAFGPERSGTLPFSAAGGGQYDVSSHVDAAILDLGAVWWPLFAPTNPGVPCLSHFGAWGSTEVNAVELGDVLVEELLGASALSYEDAAQNASTPVYMTYGLEAFDCHAYTPQTTGCPPDLPFCFGCEGMAVTKHPAWSGFVWKARHPESTRVMIVDCAVFAEKVDESATPPAAIPAGFLPVLDDGTVDLQVLDALHDDKVAWLLERFGDTSAQPSHWFEIEAVVAPDGTPCTSVRVPDAATVPRLSGSGSPSPGSAYALTLEGAAPHGVAALFAGVADDSAKLKGGLLVPASIGFALFGQQVDQDGSWTLGGTWPAAAAGIPTVYLQAWSTDASAAAGFSCSNVLLALTPD